MIFIYVYIEFGESLDIINHYKLEEMVKEFDEKKSSLETEIENLKAELNAEQKKINYFEVDRQESLGKFNDTNVELQNCRLKLVEHVEEINRLTKNNDELKLEINSGKSRMGMFAVDDNVENIMEMFGTLCSGRQFSSEEKTRLLKSLVQVLGMDFGQLERSHDVCQNMITKLDKQLQNVSDEVRTKDLQITDLNNSLYDLEQQLSNTNGELFNTRMDKEEISQLYQRHKAKSADTEFKLKNTIVKTVEDRKEAYSQNINLKVELSMREMEVQKSNQEFNILRKQFDECLDSLHRMANDCDDYEKVIVEVTENQRKKFRHAMCQTDSIHNPVVANTVRPLSYNGRVTSGLERGEELW